MKLPTLSELGFSSHISAIPEADTIATPAKDIKTLNPPTSVFQRSTANTTPRNPRNICKFDGCTKFKQMRGLCQRHGGITLCTVDGCSKVNKGRGFCRDHGGGKRCSIEGCDKGVQRYSLCHGHGGTRLCSVTECTRSDRGSGFCMRHQKDRLAESSHAT